MQTVAVHHMHAGMSAWAALHLPRYIHQRALKVPDMHLAKQHVKVYFKKAQGNRVQLVQEKVFGGAHRQKRKTSVWGCTGIPVPLSLSPLINFPTVKENEKKIRRGRGIFCLVQVLTLLSA